MPKKTRYNKVSQWPFLKLTICDDYAIYTQSRETKKKDIYVSNARRLYEKYVKTQKPNQQTIDTKNEIRLK